jgi:uncharacterized protein (TIGR03663 family)
MARDIAEASAADPLDRTIDLSAVRWATVAAIIALIVGAAMRLFQLNVHALSRDEASWAYNAYLFFRGQAPEPGQSLPTTGPVALVTEGISFFFFGVTDATSRLPGALFGIGAILLAFALRPFLGKPAAAGIAALMAVSPALVLASRNQITTSAGVFALLLLVVSLLRAGHGDENDPARMRWSAGFGIGLGLVLASGPAALSALLALAIGVLLASIGGATSAPRAGLMALVTSRRQGIAAVIAFVVTVLTFFTQLFSSLSSLKGIGTTFSDWARLVGNSSSTTPGQFFVLAIGLYELLAVLFAIVAVVAVANPEKPSFGPALFGGWFIASLVLFSLSSGRQPEQAAYVILPLVLLAGIGLGDTVERIDPITGMGARGWSFVAVMIGVILSFCAIVVLGGRIGNDNGASQSWTDLFFVILLVFIPFLATAVYIARIDKQIMGTTRIGGWVLLSFALVLGAVVIRNATQLSYTNIDSSGELLAQETSTGAVKPLVERLRRLSLDNTRTDGTIEDPTGGHGLSIAIDRRVAEPYAWYFRDFPDMTITPQGQAASSGADIVIAPDETGLIEAGYSSQPYNTVNRVPGTYTAPHIGTILGDIINPSNWRDSIDYLLYRTVSVPAAPASIQVGLSSDLAQQLFPDDGPYSLLERVGPGTGRGQFNGPRGIATGANGTVYVVDSSNARIQVFDADGAFVTSWDAQSGVVDLTISNQGLGPTGIAVGSDGLIFIADTWGHRVIVLDSSGNLVREFGTFADTQDATDASPNPGAFFGPRAVAVTDTEIYVVDTGNERVEVFGPDGSFKRAFGGKGNGPGQLSEPVGVTIGPDGLVYVADSGNARISVFAQDGTPVAQWPVQAWTGHAYFEPYLTFGNDGLLYATSSATGSVEVFGKGGELLGSITTAGTQPLGKPSGITTATDGSLLVTDIGNSGVYRIEPLDMPNLSAVAITAGDVATPPAEASPNASPVASPAP